MTATAAPAGRRSLLPADPVLRRLAVMTGVNTVGNGLYYSVSALYFTRQVGLGAAQLAIGLGAAGVAGMLAGVPFGRLADKLGHRRLLYVLGPMQGVAVLGYVFVHGFAPFVAAIVVATVLERGAIVVRSALIAHLLPADGQVRSRALLRSVMNAGLMLGGAGAALALQQDSHWAYATVLALDAASFAATSLLLRGLPDAQVPAGERARTERPGRRSPTGATCWSPGCTPCWNSSSPCWRSASRCGSPPTPPRRAPWSRWWPSSTASPWCCSRSAPAAAWSTSAPRRRPAPAAGCCSARPAWCTRRRAAAAPAPPWRWSWAGSCCTASPNCSPRRAAGRSAWTSPTPPRTASTRASS
ncbi:MFS transporter [Kitasatospora cheerisanensis]|uniref:MFS transporter n=1 Tax=Kitasatospora cheerisanensis TaxID=81942 RepID=UPI000A00F701|nr:MFS transporter [Kitasatospora cheerisanensis]